MASALIGAQLGTNPLSPSVQTVLEAELGTPAFTARAHRLFGEMLASPSTPRRKRLAAVLLAGPAVLPDPDSLDRVDMLVAQLLDPDVALLARLAALQAQGRKDGVNNEGWSVVLFQRDGWHLQVDPRGPGQGPQPDFITEPVGVVSIHALDGARCIILGRDFQHDHVGGGRAYARTVAITPVGDLLLDALSREPIGSVLRKGP